MYVALWGTLGAAVLAYGLLRNARRRPGREAIRRREAQLFARRRSRAAADDEARAYVAGEQA
jgi:hypothetical protein